MKYLSVCSGIEAATAAWHPLKWVPVAFSEIDKFPSAILRHHYPTVPNLGDMTKYKEWKPYEEIDLLVGGTPCQSFSIAGLRKGLEDPRGNLMFTYLAIAESYQPRWLVWENVPGVLSSNRGRDFGTFLGTLGNLGYGFAFRVLDAQWFGVAQRRRRVFVVGCLGDAGCAAQVLFESESVRRNPTPSREKRQKIAATLTAGFGERGIDADQIANGNYAIGTDCYNGSITGEVAATLGTPGSSSNASGPTVMQAMCFDRQSSGEYGTAPVASTMAARDHKGASDIVVHPIVLMDQGGSVMNVMTDGTIGTLRRETKGHEPSILCFSTAKKAGTLRANPDSGFQSDGSPVEGVVINTFPLAVRRLTPRECERLQGFPDDYTAIPWGKKSASECPDGLRYKALGNSMAVPVMRWIGERIDKLK